MQERGKAESAFIGICAFVGFWTIIVGAYLLLSELPWHSIGRFIEPAVGLVFGIAFLGAIALIGIALAASPIYSAWGNRRERSAVGNVLAVIGAILGAFVGCWIVLIVVEVSSNVF